MRWQRIRNRVSGAELEEARCEWPAGSVAVEGTIGLRVSLFRSGMLVGLLARRRSYGPDGEKE